uniref:Si:dkey-57n24.6 n=1 Tax=Scleropages formosus TaxID=113540 RepID=A0A8C9QRL4_SCLFO
HPKIRSELCFQYKSKRCNSRRIHALMCHFSFLLSHAVDSPFCAQVLMPWQEGDQVWLAWSHCVKAAITRDLVLKLASHRVAFRVWDTKDRLSSKARRDRPRTFRLQQGRGGDDADHEGKSGCFDLPAARCSSLYIKSESQVSDSPLPKAALTSSGVRDQPQVVNQKSLSHRNALESAACTENTHKNGVASVELNPVHLLAGMRTALFQSEWGECSAGFPCLCSITVDKALMSEELRMKLNPLVITVLSATSLPASPVPFHVLKVLCLPVYCQYKLPDMTMHRTKGEEHGSDLYFRDVNVILTGLLDPDELQQYLGGPPLEIEIHDRDRKLEEPATSPTVFGTEAEDNRLGSVSLLSCRRTRFNPFVNSTSRQDPYGIATVDLSELLRGQRRFKATAAIKCSPPPDLSVCRWAEHEERMLGFPGVAYGPLEDPMPMGHYFEANSELKVQVEIAHPLKHNIWHLGYPFGRIIYFFRCKSSMALTRLRSEILKINAAAFHLNSATEEMIEKTLSCYEMSASEKNSKEMDVVTGFYLYDNKTHLFVLEGLKDKAIRRLWEKVPIKLSGSEEDQTKILYNSDQSFSTRLYHTLDLSLSPIHLHEALDNIMKQPLLYVREMVPRACFQALSRQKTAPNRLGNCCVRKWQRFTVLSLLPFLYERPSCRFAYFQGYHSTTVASVDADVEQRSLEPQKWPRIQWFPFSHVGCSFCRRLPCLLCLQPWKENILHSNILRPTLTRDTWPWSKRFEDFNLYKKPSGFFDSEVPVTIHLAGKAPDDA